MFSTAVRTTFRPREIRSTPATEIVASPVSTTPRFSKRSASSSRESSSELGVLRLTNLSGIAGLQATEAIRRPGAAQHQAIHGLGPVCLQAFDPCNETSLVSPRHEQTRANQR